MSDEPKPAVSADDIARAAATLEHLVDDRGHLAKVSKEVQNRLLIAAGKVSQPSPWEKRRLNRAARKKRREELRARDEELLNGSGIRMKRAETIFATPAATTAPAVGRPPATAGAELDNRLAPARLLEPRTCYVCKAAFDQVHFFYDSLCSRCAEENYAKRSPVADLRGRVALVTGARLKIGYQAAIMLLRAGARVVVTTRFPRDAATRYSAEDDFESWSGRLEIHGIDLRHTPSVEVFAAHLVATLPRLDFIINNACQTVRKPVGFYSHLIEEERVPFAELAPAAQSILRSYNSMLSGGTEQSASSQGASLTAVNRVHNSAELSQLALIDEDRERSAHLFPTGHLDADLQQVDLRTRNSWRLGLDEVSAVELLEVQLVNAVAPFVLNARLRTLMDRREGHDKHIVNVSAMEGQFYRSYKTDRHPHTNMAKAALNMMTRTAAADYVKTGIHMNSVDTGWITDEDPVELARRKTDDHGFHPPLDIVDGAARIVAPIFDGISTGDHQWGLFLKDYKPTDW